MTTTLRVFSSLAFIAAIAACGSNSSDDTAAPSGNSSKTSGTDTDPPKTDSDAACQACVESKCADEVKAATTATAAVLAAALAGTATAADPTAIQAAVHAASERVKACGQAKCAQECGDRVR